MYINVYKVSSFLDGQQMLTKHEVIEIYQHKIELLAKESSNGLPHVLLGKTIRGKSSPLARIYGVNSRTIRDVWNRHTWRDATHHLWKQEEQFLIVKSKRKSNQQVHVCKYNLIALDSDFPTYRSIVVLYDILEEDHEIISNIMQNRPS
jgi:hypothetical protein